MARNGWLFGVLLLAALQASAQDYAGTYGLRGADSAGNAVTGWVRIGDDGQLEHYTRGGGKVVHVTLEGSFAAGVFTAQRKGSAGITGGLSGARAEGVEGLEVRPGGGEVAVVYTRGAYRVEAQGVRDDRRHDLKRLRDESPAATFRLRATTRTVVPQPRVRAEQVIYRARTGVERELRTYQEVSADGKQLVERGTTQELTRTADGWEPKWGRGLRGAKQHGLLTSTFRQVGVTELVPAAPVAVGETWTLSASEGARILGQDPTSARGTVEGQLVGVEEVEGGNRYRIQLTFQLEVGLQGFEGPASLEVSLRISQTPTSHTVHGRVQVEGNLQRGGRFVQQTEHDLTALSLPE